MIPVDGFLSPPLNLYFFTSSFWMSLVFLGQVGLTLLITPHLLCYHSTRSPSTPINYSIKVCSSSPSIPSLVLKLHGHLVLNSQERLRVLTSDFVDLLLNQILGLQTSYFCLIFPSFLSLLQGPAILSFTNQSCLISVPVLSRP